MKQRALKPVLLLAAFATVFLTGCGVNFFQPFSDVVVKASPEGLTQRADALYARGPAYYEEAWEMYNEAITKATEEAAKNVERGKDEKTNAAEICPGAFRGRASLRLDLAATNVTAGSTNFLLSFLPTIGDLMASMSNMGGDDDGGDTNGDTNSGGEEDPMAMLSMFEDLQFNTALLAAVELSIQDIRAIPTPVKTEADYANLTLLRTLGIFGDLTGLFGDVAPMMESVMELGTMGNSLNSNIDAFMAAPTDTAKAEALKADVSNYSANIATAVKGFSSIMNGVDNMIAKLDNLAQDTAGAENIVSSMVTGIATNISAALGDVTNAMSFATIDMSVIDSMVATTTLITDIVTAIPLDDIMAQVSNGTVTNSEEMIMSIVDSIATNETLQTQLGPEFEELMSTLTGDPSDTNSVDFLSGEGMGTLMESFMGMFSSLGSAFGGEDTNSDGDGGDGY